MLFTCSISFGQVRDYLNVIKKSDLRDWIFQHGQLIAVTGISSLNDTPIETWYYDENSMAVDDGTDNATAIKPNGILSSDPGRYLKTMGLSDWNSTLNKPIIPTDNNQLTNGSGYITASSTNTLTNKSGNISQWTNNSGYLTAITPSQINTALGYTPYNGTTNPNGFLTSFTEVDPTVPAYSKTLNAFSVIKSSTDPLYKAIGYTPTSLEITTALGFTPLTNGRTLTINGTTFDLSANRSWTVGDVTTATLTTGLATKENTITAGTTSQYWRGDKTWQTLDKTAVGLANVDNISDLNKPISSATQTALNGKQATLVSGTNIKTVGGVSILGSGDISVGSGTVTSIIAGTGLSGGTITTSGTISLPNTGTAGTYNTVTTDAQGRVISGFVASQSSVTRNITGTSFQVSTTQSSRVKYTVTHTVALTLLLSSGSSMAYLEISPNNSTWTLVDQAGFSRALTVAVALNDSMTNNVSAEVPAGYYIRIRTVTSGGGSASYTCGQEATY